MTMYAYIGNKDVGDGTTELALNSGTIALGGWGDFNAQEFAYFDAHFYLVPAGSEQATDAELSAAIAGVSANIVTVQNNLTALDGRVPKYIDAVGDDVVDDSTAIQNAINALGSTPNLIALKPGKTYKILTGLVVPAYHTFIWRGATIHYTGAGAAISFGTGTLSVDDPDTGGGLIGGRITGSAAGTAGVKIRGATRWFAENIRVDGFTAAGGFGLLLNGASFIGRIVGGRYKGNGIGVGARKQAGDGTDGRGMAFNGIEMHGVECHNNGYGVQLGDPANTEAVPVVGTGFEMHGCTLEGNTIGGYWNVSAYKGLCHGNYFEGNTAFDVREGSTSGNTITPLSNSYRDNLHFVAAIGYDIARANRPWIERNYIYGGGVAIKLSTVTNFVVDHPRILYNFVNGPTDFVQGGANDKANYTVHRDYVQAGGASPVEYLTAYLHSTKSRTPANSAATLGVNGVLTWDANFLYLEFGGTVKRVAIAAF